MNKAAISSLAVGFALALAGCGGGGGGADPAPVDLVEITSSNSKAVAGAALLAALEGGNFGAFALPGTGAFGGTSTKTAQLYAKVGAIQEGQTASLVKQSRAGYMQAVVGPETTQCAVGGSVTVTGDIANAQTLSAGDRITLEFFGCDDGSVVVDGTFSMTITSFSGDFDNGLFLLGVRLELTAFEVVEDGEAVTANGAVTLTINMLSSPTLTLTVTSTSLAVSGGGASHALTDFSLSQTVDAATGDYSADARGAVTSSAFAGAATFETTVPFSGSGASRPGSGELLITGAGGATLRVIVLDTTFVRLELDSNGDGAVDEVTDSTWDELT